MKIFRVKPEEKDQIKLHAQKQVEKRKVYQHTEKLRAGHRCFEINTKTLEVKEAEYERHVYFLRPDVMTIIIKPDCVYITAMNKENALKVYKNGGRKITTPFMSFADIYKN